MSVFRGYVGAKSCTGGPQPGVVAFSKAALAAVPQSHSDGIYNCRDVRGSTTTTSLHGEGRAFDWGCAKGAPWAQQAADLLVSVSAQLGIQCVIYNRRIWSGAHPSSGWRAYSGVDSHTTHLHIEFSWAAAEHLTQAQAAHYLTPLEDDMADPQDVWKVQIQRPNNTPIAAATSLSWANFYAYQAAKASQENLAQTAALNAALQQVLKTGTGSLDLAAVQAAAEAGATAAIKKAATAVAEDQS